MINLLFQRPRRFAVVEFDALLHGQDAIRRHVVGHLKMDFELEGVLKQPVFRVLDLDLNILLDARIDMRLHMLNRLVSLISLPLPVRQIQLLIKFDDTITVL